MDSLVFELEKLTHSMIERLNLLTSEELVQNIDARQAIIDQIVSFAATEPLNEQHKATLQAVIGHDELIRGRLEYFKREASDWLQQRDRAKMQRSAYEVSYSPDSILMDKRK
jgi:hypothetical protein